MKKNLIIVLLLAIALGVFYFSSKKSEQRAGIEELQFARIESSHVTRIAYDGVHKFSLEKRGEDFVIVAGNQTMSANPEVIRQLFEAVATIRDGVFITEQKSQHELLKVTETTGEKVTLFSGNKAVWSYIIGDYAEEGGRYIRRPGEDAVYLSRGHFWDITRNNMHDFRERRIVTLPSSEIKMVQILKGVARKDASLEPEYVKMVANLRALHFVDSPADIAVAREVLENAYSLIVQGKEGTPPVVVRLSRDLRSKRAFAKREGNESIFEISDYICKQLIGPLKVSL